MSPVMIMMNDDDDVAHNMQPYVRYFSDNICTVRVMLYYHMLAVR